MKKNYLRTVLIPCEKLMRLPRVEFNDLCIIRNTKIANLLNVCKLFLTLYVSLSLLSRKPKKILSYIDMTVLEIIKCLLKKLALKQFLNP